MRRYRLLLWCALLRLASGVAGAGEEGLPSFFMTEVARLTRLAQSPAVELRIEAARGFHLLQHASGEALLLPLATDAEPSARVAAVQALGVCGGRAAVAALIERLRDADWEVRVNAHDALLRMTAQDIPATMHHEWRAWLDGSTWEAKEDQLLAGTRHARGDERQRALKALRHLGSPRCEAPLLARFNQVPRLTGHEQMLAIRALERFGSAASLPVMAMHARRFVDVAWALGEIGGPDAEKLLHQAFARFGTSRVDAMVNLDRLKSRRCEPHLPALLQAFGLVIYRSQTDDLHLPPNARQRVAANLILRTGKAQQVVHLILAECEGRRRDAETPPALRKLLGGMRHELKPGFVRSDGRTVAQPLAALPHITRDRSFVPRLVKLLRHPAYIVRIYAAETLAALQAREAAPAILAVVREPYRFCDATALVSGKHFSKSWTVRWRGFLCIALGRLGGETARLALEGMATDAKAFRDIRYGSIAGLRYMGSAKSLPALRRVAAEDIIWTHRDEARSAIHEIELQQRLQRQAQSARRPNDA